jgi:hypothetical protein
MSTLHDVRMVRLRALSRLMDSAFEIPGTGFRIGLDAIIGLVPGAGDMVGSIVSGYILLEAMRLGAPTSLLFRMFFNVVVDSLVGAVPGAGDVFDAFWKTNNRNMALLESHFSAPAASRKANRRFALVVLLMAFTFLAAFAFLMAAAFIMVAKLFGV